MKRGNPHTIKGKGFDAHPENINRKGYPKGLKNRSTLLKYWIEQKTKRNNPLTEKKIEATFEDFKELALIEKAISGDVAAIKEINDTLHGKIADKSEIKAEGNLIINLIKGDRRSG